MRKLIPRKFERRRIVGQATLTPSAGPPLEISVVDLAQSGIAAFANRTLPEGEPVEVKFRMRQSAPATALGLREGRVVRCRALPEGNVLGISFVRPLAPEDLLQLMADWVRS